MATKKSNTTSCSDWHLGWGIGYTSLGKLTKISDNEYHYKGTNQGRHGQKLGSGSCTIIVEKIISDNDIEYRVENREGGFSLPCYSELIKSIRNLNN